MNKLLKKILVTCNTLRSQFFTYAGSVDDIEYVETGYKTDDNPPTEGWKKYTDRMRFFGNDKHYWLKLHFKTPSVTKHQYVALTTATGYEGERDTINPQCMVFIDGKIVQALDTNHSLVRLEPDREYQIFIYYYMGSDHDACEFRMWLSYIDETVEQLYYDMFVPFQACRDVYTENSYEFANTVKVLEQACNMLDLNYPYTEAYYDRICQAGKFLKEEYYEKMCGNSPVTVNCIGHTHIDVAWLWTLAQTREKVQRSFATVLELMKHYPEYRFMMSQPQLFRYLSEVAPEMYEEIKELVKSGRWEMEGAMWLEADCNLSGGESLVRQILHGKRFLKEEFGVDSRVLWLPDVFGYSAAMPQILKKSGITHFVTSKISWNDTNVLPYDTFLWQGIDGSEIITDFITTQNFERFGKFQNETTYVGLINPSMVAGTWNRYQQKEYNNEVMLVYGWGDGGGGPTADMLEQQRRLSYGLPGIPRTKMSSLKEHLSHVEENFEESCWEIGRTPKWIGELYLEFHRGTYTSMAKNKRYNRKAEMLMQRLESLSVLNEVLANREYRKEKLYAMWDVILLNQFHDIIPGSSIKEVYDVSWKQYEELFAEGELSIREGLQALAEQVQSKDGVLVYNSLGFARSDVIAIDGEVYESGLIPAYGWKVIQPERDVSKVVIQGNTVENAYYSLTVDTYGRISRLYDKRFDREVFCQNQAGNEIQLFEDMPLEYENWELADYYPVKGRVLKATKISPVEEACRKGFRMDYIYHDSTMTQYIYLYENLQRIDVKNEIEWHEKKQLMKIAFPFRIHTNHASYDIQFGNVERSTCRNTSWDAAKFEVCGQKWVDLSEYDYGVSLLNDSKYGFSTEENVLKLTVLKCGTYPNEVADQGHHEFSYAIYPHGGDFRRGQTVKQAYSFNQPLESLKVSNKASGVLGDEFSFLSADRENIIIDTIKGAEDSEDVIIRLYDAYNCSSTTKLQFGVPIDRAQICDLMEQEICDVPISEDNTVELQVKNFEIVTLKVKKRVHI